MKYRIREQNELKPSGIEWLGDIPEGWKLLKASYLFKAKKGSNAALYTKEYCATIKGKYPVYSGQTENNGILSYISSYEMDAKKSGCILSTTVGANAMSVSHIFNKFTLSQNCMIILPKNKDLEIRFYYYYFKILFQYERNLIPEHMQPSFRMDDFYSYLSILTNKIEQQKIANFLDEKSKIFDEAISKKEQLISKLEFAKQSLISEVVMGKLRVVEQNSKLQTIKREKNELKSSGVEWLGDIPKDWQVKKLKYFTTKITSGSTPLGGSETYLDEGIPLLRSQNVHFKGLSLDNVAYISNEVHNQMKRSQLQEKDILINITGASIGRVAYVPLGFKNGNVNQHVCIVRINHKVAYYKYISLFLSINYGQDQVFINQVGTSREGLSFEDLNNFIIVFPNLEEQQKISKYLDEKLIHFDNTIEKTKQSITKLKEAKEALISQAVTGKIEVL